jgi:hypothetical protein
MFTFCRLFLLPHFFAVHFCGKCELMARMRLYPSSFACLPSDLDTPSSWCFDSFNLLYHPTTITKLNTYRRCQTGGWKTTLLQAGVVKKRSIESMMRYDESMLVRGIVKTTEAALPLRLREAAKRLWVLHLGGFGRLPRIQLHFGRVWPHWDWICNWDRWEATGCL